MNKKKVLIVSMLSVILIIICTIAGTYAVVINVINENGIDKIVNEITVRDLLTTDDGAYNSTYYNVKKTLDITDEEAELLMKSIPLNSALTSVLNSIVKYRLHNDESAKYSNEELYNIIEDSINKTDNISNELKEKVITKAYYYRQDVSDFIYDIPVTLLGENS